MLDEILLLRFCTAETTVPTVLWIQFPPELPLVTLGTLGDCVTLPPTEPEGADADAIRATLGVLEYVVGEES